MNIISTQNAPQAIGPYSQAININGLIYTSGQIPLNPDGSDDKLSKDIKTQTAQVLDNLQAVLESSQSGLNKVVKTTIFLADMNDFVAVNEIYAKYFKEHKPARSTVAVKTLPKNAKIEIEAIATI
ncbi:Bona fide RidA/YjgF/TdcF/RutC subgroup [hydrothermal vent metagenome]|uniref:Bona fide RidA/YjgF/TdcF/RutC subgroup n=1 Tax=hydrothermal vent metagenome TaxID=652676 RepID=A0A3B1E6H6_9ZZZZ